jgi:hypothetical protein
MKRCLYELIARSKCLRASDSGASTTKSGQSIKRAAEAALF